MEWGFDGADVADAWADSRDGRWHAPESTGELLAELARRGVATRRIVRAHGLDDTGMPGERWDGDDPPQLRRVLLHLLQECARHARATWVWWSRSRVRRPTGVSKVRRSGDEDGS